MGKSNTNNKSDKTGSYTDFYYHFFHNILLFGIPLVIISALALSLPHSSAEVSGGTDNVQLTLSTSCTVNAVVTEAHETSLHGGQKDDNVGNTKLSAFCNDNNGYSIYAVGSSGDIDGNTDLINTVNESYNIHTGVYNENNTSNPSSWAMKLTAGSGSGIDPVTGDSVPTTPPTIMNGYDNYSAIPSNYTLVANRISGTSMTTDTSISGSYLNTTYQIYANSAQPAGTYNGKVKYVMVHPNNSSQTTIPDLKAAFAAAGKQPAYQDEDGYYYAMQDMTTDICNSVTRTGEITAVQLVDRRDNKLYWVTKLADDKCWMTQNLDLDIGGTGVATLNSNNTDISTDPNVYASNGVYSDYTVNEGVYTWNPISTAITSNYYLSGNTVQPSAWPTNSYATPCSLEGGEAYVYSSGSTSNDTRYTSLASCATSGRTKAECKRYATGNYYNWTEAIASNDSTNLGSTPEEIATNSICPKGWRLPNSSPTDGVNNEFGRLFYMTSIVDKVSNGTSGVGYLRGIASFNELRSSPYYFVRSGRINGSALNYDGNYGDYWSSTVYDGTHSYYLNFDNSNLWPATRYSERSNGRSIRCVAR